MDGVLSSIGIKKTENLTREEAYRAMLHGYKVIHRLYSTGCFAYYFEGRFIYRCGLKKTEEPLSGAIEWRDGYSILQEKPKTNKIEVADYLVGGSSLYTKSEAFFIENGLVGSPNYIKIIGSERTIEIEG